MNGTMSRACFIILPLLIAFAAVASGDNAQNAPKAPGSREPQPIFVPGAPPTLRPSEGTAAEQNGKGDPASLTKRFGAGLGKGKGKGKDKETDDFDTTLVVDQKYVIGHPDIKYVEDNDHSDEEIDFYHSPYYQFLYPEKGVYHQDGNYEEATEDPNYIHGLKGADENYDPSKEPYKTYIYHEHPPYPIPEFPFGGLHVQYQEFIKKNRYKPYYGYKGHLGLQPKEAESFGKLVDGLFAVGAAMIAMGGAAFFFPFTWGPGIFGRTTARAFSSASSFVSNQVTGILPKVKAAFQEQECMERLVCELEARGFSNSVTFFRFVDKFINAGEQLSGMKRTENKKKKGERSSREASPTCNRSQCNILNAFFMMFRGSSAKNR